MDSDKRRRWILHADMDAFFASIEQRDHPEYRGKPLIVGGDEKRGVVSTASYEARKFGVHSAMPIAEAKRRCPQGIYVKPSMAVYATVSAKIREIFSAFSPAVEPLSLDEAFLDITGMELLYPDIKDIAVELKEQVQRNTGLTVSVGIAPNKFLAKLASDYQKPNGLVVVRPGEEAAFLAPLPIRCVWGIGKVTEQQLHALQIYTIGQLRAANPQMLERRLGQYALELYHLAWGEDEREVTPKRQTKSIGNEDTFSRDIYSQERIQTELLRLAEQVGRRLRAANLAGRTVTLKVRFTSFRTLTRAVTLEKCVDLDEIIYDMAWRMMSKIPLTEGIRLLGITVSNFSHSDVQLNLFEEADKLTEKRKKIAGVMDQLNERYGSGSVKRGRLLDEKQHQKE